jgi:hypothetical protein
VTDISTSTDGAAPVAAGATPDSPPAQAPAPTAPTGKAAMVARLRERKSATTSQPDASRVVEAEPTATSEPETPKEATTKEPESVPMAAFKERLARASEQVRGYRDQVNQRDLELAKAREAFTLLTAEYQRLREQAGSGAQIDERDEQIRSYEIEKQVREVTERLTQEHQQRIAQAMHEARVSEIREQLSSEIDSATAQFPLVDRRELIAALRESPSADALALAKSIHERKVDIAKSYLVSPKPPVPSTASPSTVGSVQRFPNDRDGMAAFLRSRREARGQ